VVMWPAFAQIAVQNLPYNRLSPFSDPILRSRRERLHK
jgi:hypothetical protein